MRTLLIAMALIAISCSHTPTAEAGSRRDCVRSGAYSVSITDRQGRPLPTWRHRGRTWVLGQRGERYRIKIRNRSWRRIEAVVSVDGRDAIDGKTANWRKPGYVIEAQDELVIEGFRVSMSTVATFRFSSVRNSYAARMGSARDVGVIGVAIFEERRRPIRQRQSWLRQHRRRPALYDNEDERSLEHPRTQASPSPPPRGKAAPGPSITKGGSARAGGGVGAFSEARRRRPSRPGLGTAFGERRGAPAVEVVFRRAYANRPTRILSLRYNDTDGLIAQGIDLRPHRRRHSEQWRRATARPFSNLSRRFASPPPRPRP